MKKQSNPQLRPSELEIQVLSVLWRRGASTAREMLDRGAARIQRELADRGLFVAYMPTYSGLGPEGALRLAVFSVHTDEMIEKTVKMNEHGAELVEKTNSDFKEVTVNCLKVGDLVGEIH